MRHSARQQAWAAAAREPGPALAVGLFALLSEPNAEERAAGITTSPLAVPAPVAAEPAPAATIAPAPQLEPDAAPRCAKCGMAAHEPDQWCDTVPPGDPDPAA